MCVLPVCMFVSYVHTVPEEARKKVLDSLELQLHRVVSHQIVAGNQVQALWKSGQGS